jgi:hypothetical protein
VARLLVDEWLVERRPTPDLADLLVCVWRGDLGAAATPLLARAQPGPPRLAGLAAAAGYVDQQHLAHEVRAIMGTTPGRLLRGR